MTMPANLQRASAPAAKMAVTGNAAKMAALPVSLTGNAAFQAAELTART